VRVHAAERRSEQGIDDRADGPADTTGFYGLQSRDELRRTAVGARVDWRGPGTVLTVGAELERQRLDQRSLSQSEFGDTPDSLFPRRRSDALFVQLLAGLDRPLTVQAGARLDESGQYGRFVTVRAAAVYRADAATRLRAAIGTGFKEPTLFETFARGFVVGNPALQPERTRSVELGLEHAIGRVTLAATYFDQQFRDLVEFTFAPAPPDTVNFFNISGAAADGVELEARAPLGRVAATLRYTYLDTRVTDAGFDTSPDAAFAPGQRLLRRPADQAMLRLDATPTRRVDAYAALRYTGTRHDLDFAAFPFRRVVLGAAATVDAGAELRWPVAGGSTVRLTARVENLFDHRSRETANFPARGRVILLGGRVAIGG
jgi:vitamin B12 transporter